MNLIGTHLETHRERDLNLGIVTQRSLGRTLIKLIGRSLERLRSALLNVMAPRETVLIQKFSPMTKPKLEPVRAWCLAVDGKINPLFMYKNESEAGMCAYQQEGDVSVLKVLITPVLPTHPPELSGNTGELKQTKQPLSYQEVLQKVFHPTPDQDELNYWHNKCDQLESQLEDYRKALEWLFKNYDPEDFLEERNGDYRLLHGIKNYFAATPLSAIQKAMEKEESRNE